MDVTYLTDTGSRCEWSCEKGGRRYVVSYHYLNDSWSVQLLRDDGYREILNADEAEGVLDAFPLEEAFNCASAEILRGPSVWARWKKHLYSTAR